MTSTWGWTAWWCGPILRPASRIRWRRRSSSPRGWRWWSSRTPARAPSKRRARKKPRKFTTSAAHNASSSRKNSPARYRASPFPRSSRGCSRSTIRSAPVPPAAGSASSSTSTPISSFPTGTARYAAARSRRGRNRARPTTRRRCWRSASITSSRSTPNGRTCRRKRRTRSSTARARTRSNSSTTTGCAYETRKPFEGVVTNLERRWRETDSDWAREEMAKYFTDIPCAACKGHRLKPEALCVRVGGLHIGEVADMSVKRAGEWFTQLPDALSAKQNEIAVRVLKEIRERLKFLVDVGLEYLTLARASGTLSGGESQRIRLASQIGSGLTGVLYVLDEPSIGLHQRDNARLLETLKRLRDLGNTVIVVEHDEDA